MHGQGSERGDQEEREDGSVERKMGRGVRGDQEEREDSSMAIKKEIEGECEKRNIQREGREEVKIGRRRH